MLLLFLINNQIYSEIEQEVQKKGFALIFQNNKLCTKKKDKNISEINKCKRIEKIEKNRRFLKNQKHRRYKISLKMRY